MARRLGELLVSEGRISEAVLARALEIQGTQARGLPLGAILLRWGLLPERALLESLSLLHRCSAVDWETLSAAKPEAVNLLTPAQSKRLSAVPYAADRKIVRVAFANPSNLAVIDEVQAITGRRVIPSVTTEVRLLQAQQRFYRRPLARDIWAIVQKIERPAPPPPPPIAASISPAVSPVLDPANLWIENESGGEEGAAVQPQESAPEAATEDGPVEDLVESAPAPQEEPRAAAPELAIELEPLEELENTVPVLAPKAADSDGFHSFLDALPLTELLEDRADLFSDDTPLDEFIEQALAFYEAHPTFRSALAALDDGSVEDLDNLVEEERPRRMSLDSTHPSPRRRRPDYESEELIL